MNKLKEKKEKLVEKLQKSEDFESKDDKRFEIAKQLKTRVEKCREVVEAIKNGDGSDEDVKFFVENCGKLAGIKQKFKKRVLSGLEFN